MAGVSAKICSSVSWTVEGWNRLSPNTLAGGAGTVGALVQADSSSTGSTMKMTCSRAHKEAGDGGSDGYFMAQVLLAQYPPAAAACQNACMAAVSGRRQHHHFQSGRRGRRVVDPLRRLLEVLGLGRRDVGDGLRVQVHQREPRALHLHHDAVAAPERMVDVTQVVVDRLD